MSSTITNIIPTLDSQSVLVNPSDQLAYILRYYFTAPKSVSNTSLNYMISFADTASRYQNVATDLITQVTQDLMGVYNRFFPPQATTVNVSAENNGNGTYNITVQVSTVVNGTSYALGSDVTVNATGVLQIKYHPQFTS